MVWSYELFRHAIPLPDTHRVCSKFSWLPSTNKVVNDLQFQPVHEHCFFFTFLFLIPDSSKISTDNYIIFFWHFLLFWKIPCIKSLKIPMTVASYINHSITSLFVNIIDLSSTSILNIVSCCLLLYLHYRRSHYTHSINPLLTIYLILPALQPWGWSSVN